MENIEIYKKLKRCYNEVVKEGYNILGITIIDDIFTALVIPSLEDFLSHKYNVFLTKLYIPDIDEYIVIRFLNSNIDLLYKDHTRIINKKYRSYLICFDNKDSDLITPIDIYNLEKSIIETSLKEELNINVEKVIINKYKNIFVTSDIHFGHKNIIKYENRQEALSIDNIIEHDEEIITRWNDVVGKKDLVFILGDLSFRNIDETMNILNNLNGDKILIKGNHDDMYLKKKRFDTSLFKEILDYKEFNYNGYNVCMMHYPINYFRNQDKEKNPAVMLHGHIHSNPVVVPKYSYNVCMDLNNYAPIKLQTAIDKALSNNKENNINGRF